MCCASPRDLLAAAGERQPLAGRQLDDVLAQRADAQLRPGQVLQDRHRAARAPGGVAHAADRLGVLLERAVRVVQPRHVHPRLDHAQQRLGLARGGPDGGDDLRAAHRPKVSSVVTRSSARRRPLRRLASSRCSAPRDPCPRVGARARIAHFGGGFEPARSSRVHDDGRRSRCAARRARCSSSCSAPPPRGSSRPAARTGRAWSCSASAESDVVATAPARRGSARRSARAARRAPTRAPLGWPTRKRASSSRWRSIGAPAIAQRTARRSNSSSTARCQASSRVAAARPPRPASVSAYSRRVAGVSEPRSVSTLPSRRCSRCVGRAQLLAAAAALAHALAAARCPRRAVSLASARVARSCAAHVARHRLGVAGPGGRGLQRGELAHARARLLGVVVVDRRRHVRRAVCGPTCRACRSSRCTAPGGRTRATAPIWPGAWPGQVDDAEAGDLVALGDRAGDLHRAAVPGVAVQQPVDLALRDGQPGEVRPASSESRRCLRRPAPRRGGTARARPAPARRRGGRCGRGRARSRWMPPSFAPALATARTIVRAPASNSVTPPSSSIRYTLQRPGWPCTTHTPSATSFASPPDSRVQARLGVEGARQPLLGAPSPAAASCRSGARSAIESGKASLHWIRPSRTVSRSSPRSSSGSPVGATPLNDARARRRCRVRRHCTAQRSSCGRRRDDSHVAGRASPRAARR